MGGGENEMRIGDRGFDRRGGGVAAGAQQALGASAEAGEQS
jgi:hypothetical protein